MMFYTSASRSVLRFSERLSIYCQRYNTQVGGATGILEAFKCLVLTHVDTIRRRPRRKRTVVADPLWSDTVPGSSQNSKYEDFTLSDADIEACCRDILVLCNRTQSGGDTYFCVEAMLAKCGLSIAGCHTRYANLSPFHCESDPLKIHVEIVDIEGEMDMEQRDRDRFQDSIRTFIDNAAKKAGSPTASVRLSRDNSTSANNSAHNLREVGIKDGGSDTEQSESSLTRTFSKFVRHRAESASTVVHLAASLTSSFTNSTSLVTTHTHSTAAVEQRKQNIDALLAPSPRDAPAGIGTAVSSSYDLHIKRNAEEMRRVSIDSQSQPRSNSDSLPSTPHMLTHSREQRDSLRVAVDSDSSSDYTSVTESDADVKDMNNLQNQRRNRRSSTMTARPSPVRSISLSAGSASLAGNLPTRRNSVSGPGSAGGSSSNPKSRLSSTKGRSLSKDDAAVTFSESSVRLKDIGDSTFITGRSSRRQSVRSSPRSSVGSYRKHRQSTQSPVPLNRNLGLGYEDDDEDVGSTGPARVTPSYLRETPNAVASFSPAIKRSEDIGAVIVTAFDEKSTAYAEKSPVSGLSSSDPSPRYSNNFNKQVSKDGRVRYTVFLDLGVDQNEETGESAVIGSHEYYEDVAAPNSVSTGHNSGAISNRSGLTAASQDTTTKSMDNNLDSPDLKSSSVSPTFPHRNGGGGSTTRKAHRDIIYDDIDFHSMSDVWSDVESNSEHNTSAQNTARLLSAATSGVPPPSVDKLYLSPRPSQNRKQSIYRSHSHHARKSPVAQNSELSSIWVNAGEIDDAIPIKKELSASADSYATNKKANAGNKSLLSKFASTLTSPFTPKRSKKDKSNNGTELDVAANQSFKRPSFISPPKSASATPRGSFVQQWSSRALDSSSNETNVNGAFLLQNPGSMLNEHKSSASETDEGPCIRISFSLDSRHKLCCADPQGDFSDNWAIISSQFTQVFYIHSNCKGRATATDRLVTIRLEQPVEEIDEPIASGRSGFSVESEPNVKRHELYPTLDTNDSNRSQWGSEDNTGADSNLCVTSTSQTSASPPKSGFASNNSYQPDEGAESYDV
jgi:hypothetical protein